ncbi:MAG TPA: TonB-dependent receptor [Vicinamibacterales bacterium]|nr:TonB-dependent receptor [Vicinamibacterales bacterium]
MRRLFLSSMLLPLVLFATVLAAAAQSGTGRISGLVKDASGAVVPGVSIVATHEATGVRQETVTNESGLFLFPSVPVGSYTVHAELPGFKAFTNRQNVLTVGADLNLTIVLQTGDVREAVVVTGESPIVQTTESSVSTLVTRDTIVTLPLNGRNPLHLIGLVPGVAGHSAEATSSGGTATHYINGDRGRGITTTQDGIDISDPVIPRGELTNSPVNPEALQEFRVITSNAKAEYGRSAGGQVELVTRSGSNTLNGTLYEFLRDTKLDSNSYFNKVSGLPKEQLRRNQFGGAIGGPLRRDRAFFFANYDGMRRTQETSQLVTVPTASMRNGVFRFVTQNCPGETTARNRPTCVDATGNALVPVSSYNVAANDPRALGLDPVMQNEILKFLPLPNDFTTGDGLNTAGYRWNSPSKSPVDSLTTRFDVTLNQRQSIFVRYSDAFRNDLINDIINTTPRPLSWPARVRLSDQQGGSFGHKWTLGKRLVNEVTGGFTRNVLEFADPQHPKTYEICRSGCVFTSPFVYWPGTSRKPAEVQFLDNLTWMRGTHAFKGGINVRKYYIAQTRGAGNPFGIYPSITFNRLDAPFTGINSQGVVRTDGSRVDLTASGINSNDRNNLNTLYNVLLGRIGRIDQVFYSNGQKFVALQPLTLDQRMGEYNFYVQDDWRLRPNLTLNLGLRYELNSVPYDASGAQVAPDKPLDGSQGPVSFVPAGPGTDRQWFARDNNNFAPSIGIAWDPTGHGRTSVRASYRMAYQRLITWALNVVEQRQPATSLNQFVVAPRDIAIAGSDQVLRLNEFLKSGHLPNPQTSTTVSITDGVPALLTPPAILRTPPNNRNEQPLFFDPNIRTPYVQQYVVGIQREMWHGTLVEATYVGSRGSKLFRMMNVNTMDLLRNGFIKDFQAARQNLLAGGNPNVGESTGNLGRLFGGTIPSSSYADIQNNNVGVIADALDRGTIGIGLGAAGLPDNFFRPNPQFSLAGLGCSCSSSEYNGLQLQLQKRLSHGLAFGANYTLSKSTDDVSNDTRGAGTELVVPSDPNHLSLDQGRSDFDVRHVVRGHAIWDLPFGKGRRFFSGASGLVNGLVGGWQINGILDVSSGFPFTVFSGFDTLTFYDSGTRVATASGSGTSNRATYSGNGPIGGVRRTDRGVEYFNTAERALFGTPEAGQTGSERNLFTGPGYFQVDFGVFKNVSVARRRLELRVEIFNLFDTVNFSDPNILATSGSFGLITDTRVPPRIIQLGMKFYF